MGVTVSVLLASLLGALPERFALVVGHNQPDVPDIPVLRYADDDAVATHHMLVEAGVTSILLTTLDDETAQALPDVVVTGPPTRAAVAAAFEQLRRGMQAARDTGGSPEFLLYYSGHGNIRDGEGYVVLQDGPLTRTELWEQLLAHSPAVANHVMVDACRSFFMAYGRGAGAERTRAPRGFSTRVLTDVRNRTGLMLSTSSDRESHEWERFRAGIFSHELRSALRGGADADLDGTVTYAEVGAFLEAANRAIENPRFRPEFLLVPPGSRRDVPVLGWPETDVLTVDAQDAGHLHVEDAAGTRLADVHPRPGQQAALHVPPVRPLYVRAGAAEWAMTRPGSAALATLAALATTATEKGAEHRAYVKLFDAPFGAQDVAAYAPRPVKWEVAGNIVPLPDGPQAVWWPRVRLAGTLAGAAGSAGLLGVGAAAGLVAAGVAGLDVALGWRPGEPAHRITVWQAGLRDGAGLLGVVTVGAALLVGAAVVILGGAAWLVD